MRGKPVEIRGGWVYPWSSCHNLHIRVISLTPKIWIHQILAGKKKKRFSSNSTMPSETNEERPTGSLHRGGDQAAFVVRNKAVNKALPKPRSVPNALRKPLLKALRLAKGNEIAEK